MPTVYDEDGFQIRIYLPPREHEPPHVHVFKAGAEVVINLGKANVPPEVREVYRMRKKDALRAYRLVERLKGELLRKWREYHE